MKMLGLLLGILFVVGSVVALAMGGFSLLGLVLHTQGYGNRLSTEKDDSRIVIALPGNESKIVLTHGKAEQYASAVYDWATGLLKLRRAGRDDWECILLTKEEREKLLAGGDQVTIADQDGKIVEVLKRGPSDPIPRDLPRLPGH